MVKIHPFLSCCKLNDKRMRGVYEFASRRKLFVLVHTWLDSDAYGNLDLFAGVARDYPDIKWLMGHSGGPFAGIRAVEIARELPNVFLDLTISSCPARQIEFFVKEVGSERVIFGTDNPFIDPRPQIGRLFLADISREDMVNIVGGNVRRYISFS
jgi:predicted TIM-barrel fold metal-dependent hydrolase